MPAVQSIERCKDAAVVNNSEIRKLCVVSLKVEVLIARVWPN